MTGQHSTAISFLQPKYQEWQADMEFVPTNINPVNEALENHMKTFAIYVDDKVAKDPVPFQEFGARLLRRQPQLDLILNVFTEVLDRMWDLYDPLAASTILNSTLAFVTGCCIEPELENLPRIQGVERFSWYI
ncbi:hypothetical protein Clacol_007866 [Clathrus columnatus]|uniref:Uncharacterized protein n=1 Tax=Clathrus columnatus TaxID=1419009 RepID=A0AAV5AL55_9AGAM|nr:hypothetical protein Clacol_007866 [Clathrus columnatus]